MQKLLKIALNTYYHDDYERNFHEMMVNMLILSLLLSRLDNETHGNGAPERAGERALENLVICLMFIQDEWNCGQMFTNGKSCELHNGAQATSQAVK